MKLPLGKANFSVSVSPSETIYKVDLDDNAWPGLDSYQFSIHQDGTVVLNDYRFNSREEAAKVFETMASFFKKSK